MKIAKETFSSQVLVIISPKSMMKYYSIDAISASFNCSSCDKNDDYASCINEAEWIHNENSAFPSFTFLFTSEAKSLSAANILQAAIDSIVDLSALAKTNIIALSKSLYRNIKSFLAHKSLEQSPNIGVPKRLQSKHPYR
jgi:hypothetical protein